MNINQRMIDIERRISGHRFANANPPAVAITTDLAACAKKFDEFVIEHPGDETAFRDFNTALESMKASNQ